MKLRPIIEKAIPEVMTDLQQTAYAIARTNGFHEDEEKETDFSIATRIALIGSEVFEALQAHQKRQDDHIGEELADIVIRTLDVAETLQINLGYQILEKMEKNQKRPYKHGDKRY